MDNSNTTNSFISDNTNVNLSSQRSFADSEHPSQSDDEDLGGFLMIRPIISGTSSTKSQQPLKHQNFNLRKKIFHRNFINLPLDLDQTLFPKEVVDCADSLQEANLGAYVRTLIGFIYSFRNKNRNFSLKRPVSEALYSIYFEGETLGTFKKLLQQVIAKLKEESITLKQKYRSEIEYIETKYSKIHRSSSHSIKFEEKELQKLQVKVVNILQERCLMDSQSTLNLIHHFLDRTLEKFPSIHKPNALKLSKNIIIDNITLPKLMERLLEGSGSWSSFYKTIVIYTYDLFISPQNLLLHLILRYFEPEPLNMCGSELRVYRVEVLKHSKLHILKLVKFWIEERGMDFIRNPNLITILNTFLDIIQPIEKDSEINEIIKDLFSMHEEVSQGILKHKQKLCNKADILIFPHGNSFTQSTTKPDISLITKVISATDSMYSSVVKEDALSLKHAVSLNRGNTYSELSHPSLARGESILLPSKQVKSSEEAYFRPRQSVSPKANNKFKFWSGFQGAAKVQYDHKMLLEEDSEEIAKHLTVIDWKYFSKIDISEMINKRWTKIDKSECPNYWKYVRRFNSFCSWIQYIVLSQESCRRRMEVVGKFLEIALICLRTYNNYSSSHYIFAALSSLEKFGILSMQDPLMANYEELKKAFIPPENFLIASKEIFESMKLPAIPNLNFFLKCFLKLQDGVVFWTKLAENNKLRYLKFPLLVQIHDSCKGMRRFQKSGYDGIQLQKNDVLYNFLKKDFKKGVPIQLEDQDEALNRLTKMVAQVKEKQNKLFNFFGVKTCTKANV